MTYDILFVGLDISKLKHDVAIMNENKELLCRPFIIRENRAGYQYFIDRLDQLKEKHQTKTFYIGMESTADYWKNIFYFLKKQSNGFIPVLINPVQTKAFAKAELRRAKSRNGGTMPKILPNIWSRKDPSLMSAGRQFLIISKTWIRRFERFRSKRLWPLIDCAWNWAKWPQRLNKMLKTLTDNKS